MTFYDVDLNNSEDLSYLLMKDCFTIPFKNDINEIDLRDKMPSLDNYELLGSIINRTKKKRTEWLNNSISDWMPKC